MIASEILQPAYSGPRTDRTLFRCVSVLLRLTKSPDFGAVIYSHYLVDILAALTQLCASPSGMSFFLDTTEHSTVCRCPFIPTKSNSHKRACVAHCTSGLTPATLTSAAAGTAVDPAFYIAPDEKQMCTLELDRVLTRCLFLLRCSCI